MAVTYTQAEAALANIRDAVIAARQRFDTAKSNIVRSDTELANLATTYAEVMDAIDNAPDTGAYALLKDRKAAIVSEGAALKSDTAAARTALGI